MSALNPTTEVMPRKGRGTSANNPAGNTRPMDWTSVEAR
jgi:hypothetical protein